MRSGKPKNATNGDIPPVLGLTRARPSPPTSSKPFEWNGWTHDLLAEALEPLPQRNDNMTTLLALDAAYARL